MLYDNNNSRSGSTINAESPPPNPQHKITLITRITSQDVAVATPLVYGSVQHIVGGNAGWSTVVNYSVWSAGQNFTVNDTLVFNNDTKYSVDQVNETEYNTCNSTHPLKTYTGGNTVITLSDPRELYFICPTPGLCARGMKLAVKVDQSNITSSGTARSLIATADLKLGFLLVLATILSFMD